MDILERIEELRQERVRVLDTNNPQMIFLLVAMDMDGTLTKDTCWTKEQCQNAEPNRQMIKVANIIANRDILIIWTARKRRLFEITFNWLDKWNVKNFGITDKKIPADLYIDDKSFNPFLDGHTILKNRTHRGWY